MNQKDGGNHGASNAGPRRVPCRRSRARHRPVRCISAGHQSPASLAPTLGAARTMEGPAAAAPIESSARASAQRIQSDSAPHCSWSSSALCQAEETGTKRQERTGWAAASRNQIRAQAGSSPGGWCSMPTELIEEVGAAMAASAEDSQTAGGNQRLRRSRRGSQGMHRPAACGGTGSSAVGTSGRKPRPGWMSSSLVSNSPGNRS